MLLRPSNFTKKTLLSVAAGSSITSQRQLKQTERVLTTCSTLTETGHGSLSESGRCLLQQCTYLSWISRNFISLSSLPRLEEARKRCSPSSTRASNRSIPTPKTTTCMPSLCRRRLNLPSSRSHSSLTRRSATPTS